MKIEVTQYLRPNGRTKILQVEIPDSYKGVVAKLAELDLRITCEQLTSGLVAQYISHEAGDYVIELDFPDNTIAKLLKMLDNFDEQAFKEWLTYQLVQEGEE